MIMVNEKSSNPSQISPKWTWQRLSFITVFFPFAWFLNNRFYSSSLESARPVKSTFNAIQAPKSNVWADLSDAEVADVVKFLYTGSNGFKLNLTAEANSTSWDNTIYIAEILRPNKTLSLPYILDDLKDAPPRWARIVINEGALLGNTQEYMVGPFPISDDSEVLPLEFCYNAGRSHVKNLIPNQHEWAGWADQVIMPEIKDILMELMADNGSLDSVELGAPYPTIENGRVIAWASAVRLGSTSAMARTLLSQGLHVKIDFTTRDPKNWRLLEWMYGGIIYNSTENFRTVMKQPGFERKPLNLDGDWTNMEDYSSGTAGREHPGPVMIMASPPRYGVDMQQKFVSWMGFEFYIGFAQMTGISLYDIRFRGERIAYEIGLQEALAHYAGDDPENGRRAFLDTVFAMGANMFELVSGYDCPTFATFMDTRFNRNEKTEVRKNSICLFEYTADHPLQRHTSQNYVSISRNTYFVVRSTSVVGNYDYQFDYIFYLDGSFEVKVRASGFIEGAYWAAGQSNEFGYRAHDQFQTRMHDHVLNFKADLDIAGTKNTLVRVGIEPITRDFDYDFRPRNTMHLVHRPVTKETGINWAPNAAEKIVLFNNDAENAWGEKRGFEIRPGTGMGSTPHLTILNSTTIGRAGEWAMKDIFITKQKDTEPRSAHPEAWRDVDDPLIDFGKFLDWEDIVQEDVVVWFNLGAHHVPHSGDLPNTLMHTSASSVIFTPHNFHDMDASRASRQGVRLELANRENTTYFGGRHEKDLHIKVDEIEPDLKTDYHSKGEEGKKYSKILP